MSKNTATETIARIERVCAETDCNGIYSVGSRAALTAMSAHWKEHLSEGHPASIVGTDIDTLIEHLQHVKQLLSAPVVDETSTAAQADPESDFLNQAPVDPLTRFNYMLLSRLQMDCEYFLGHGNRSTKQLWASNAVDQIAKMKELYDNLPVKPQWLTMEKIEEYAAAMATPA